MSLTFLIILSLIQGITEFLPISSSAHLILFPYFTESYYQGRSFDVCLHFGCLLAVLYYLKNDLKRYIKNSLPYFILALIFLILFFIYAEIDNNDLLPIIFTFLAAITFPHVLVIEKMYRSMKQ